MTIIQKNAKIVSNSHITGDYYKLVLKFSEINQQVKPGQFLQIRINDNYEPLLRRPFSIHRACDSNIEILYKIVGKGTLILSKRKAGEYLDIVGPLGNGFDYRSPSHQVTKSQVLVAGGIGVAPLFFLAEQLAKRTTHDVPRTMQVLIGAKTKNQVLCEKEFRKLGCDVKIATDDGSMGFPGRVTELLESILSANLTNSTNPANSANATIYACGPRPMLKEIANISKKYNIPAQISLEEHMACGIGACLGCVVNTKNGYQRVCKEGPVFAADEIV